MLWSPNFPKKWVSLPNSNNSCHFGPKYDPIHPKKKQYLRSQIMKISNFKIGVLDSWTFFWAFVNWTLPTTEWSAPLPKKSHQEADSARVARIDDDYCFLNSKCVRSKLRNFVPRVNTRNLNSFPFGLRFLTEKNITQNNSHSVKHNSARCQYENTVWTFFWLPNLHVFSNTWK